MHSRRVLVLFVLIITVLVGLHFWREFHRKNADLSKVDPAFSVTASQLINEFSQNDSIAEKKYLGNVIAVNGPVKKVRSDDKYCTVMLGDSTTSYSVQCEMDTIHLLEASNLKKASSVIIKGLMTGFQKDETGLLGSDIKLNRCVLVK